MEFFNRGLHKLIEDIVLALDTRSVLACLGVSCYWYKIVTFYCGSKNTKFQYLQDLKIIEEWWKKTPVIYQISLENFNIVQIKCLHIISDGNEVAIAALINGTKAARIILVNSKTATVNFVLVIANSNRVDLNVIEMKMAMDETFLVAYICAKNSSFYQVWNQKYAYSSNYTQLSCLPEQWHNKFAIIGTHLQNVPFLKEGRICVSTKGRGSKIEIKEWKISDNTQITSLVPTAKKDWNEQRIIHKFGMLTLHNDFSDNKKVIIFNNNNGGFREISIPKRHYPKVIGHSDEYIAIHLYNPL